MNMVLAEGIGLIKAGTEVRRVKEMFTSSKLESKRERGREGDEWIIPLNLFVCEIDR